jgi:hypothetical protein
MLQSDYYTFKETTFISDLYIFPLISTERHFQYQWTDWQQTHYDVTNKNNYMYISYEGHNTHYHKCHSYQTRSDTSDNVSLDLHNCRYSTFIGNLFICPLGKKITVNTMVSYNFQSTCLSVRCNVYRNKFRWFMTTSVCV